MGKKSKSKDNNKYPFVSICTPTFNRRPFIDAMIKCFNHQTYPKEKLEWIIIDDGTDKIKDLVEQIPQVKYFSYNEKMVLGKKRNLMHEKSSGEIIVYMDDDDYYPPERVSHAVNMLTSHPTALCAGASEIYIYFKHIYTMYQFGPYGPNHATAGTFAFKRELLKLTSYNEAAALAEEKEFLKNYSIPFVQLEPKKTILVFSHDHNTFDKKTLLDNQHPKYCKPSDKKVEDFIKEENLKNFYVNVEEVLKDYNPGLPSMKPDVLDQIEKISKEREQKKNEMMSRMENNNSYLLNNNQSQSENMNKNFDDIKNNPELIGKMLVENNQKIHQNQVLMNMFLGNVLKQETIVGEFNGKSKPLNNSEIIEILTSQKNEIHRLEEIIKEKDNFIKNLTSM